ncbi:MAG: YbaB/EbfC family nucleoid-associated protein [Alphaproteobacteria bacterium]|uniref:YbaB/EbfC family nucleoid-associated protein n=1 Tax=Sandarakinorhabdus sp. DWP1-3-1 TaxID=2804627 RepID=UPI000DB5AA6E|nr:MAG: YbaB/EbfC family nucleoid-associated protein [Alphaproteobacteria bacterium]
MPSLDELMKAAQSVQEQMAKAQAELDNIEVEGGSGGGLVKVRATARGRILGIVIDPSLLTADSKEMLEDLVVAAFNDAKAKADQAGSAEMNKLTAGMPLPPGFKLPGL